MRVFACVVAFTVLATGCAREVPEQPRTRIRFASGMPGGGFFPFGEALAREYERVLPTLQVELHESDGAASNIEAIERGEADVGLSHADSRLPGLHRPARGTARGVHAPAGHRDAAAHPAARRRQGRAPAFRGWRISAGAASASGGPGGRPAPRRPRWCSAPTGSTSASVTLESLRYDEAAARLAQGTLDALLVNGSYPLDAVMQAAKAGARLLSIDGPPIDRLRRAYPFFNRAVIPAGTYPGQTTAIRTIGVDSLLVCRADLSEVLVHDLTQRLFEILPLLSSSNLAQGPIDVDRAPATPIPLHDGAARYYRERELSR